MRRITLSIISLTLFVSAATAADAPGSFTTLTASGVVDFNGSTLAFADIGGGNPAFNLNYISSGTSIAWASPLTTANWIWLQGTSQTQLKLSSANQLLVYLPRSATVTTDTVGITLDPAGTSTFAKGITVGGVLNASGGFAMPSTGTTAAQGLNFGDTNLYRSAAGVLRTDKAVQIGTTLTVGGNVAIAGTVATGKNAATSGAGLTTTYTDGDPNATVSNAVSRQGTYWKFFQNNSSLKMQLDPANRLSLYDSSAAATVVLDPAAQSTFKFGLTSAKGMTLNSVTEGENNLTLRRSDISPNRLWVFSQRPSTEVGNPLGFLLYSVEYPLSGSRPYKNYILAKTDGSMAVGLDGNVGVGTSSPAAKLDVSGALTVRGDVKVTGVIRVLPAGDLSMGTFALGNKPTP
jgi:hypothetical protein